MCIAFIVLLLENTKLFYALFLFCLYLEILAVSSSFKWPIAMKCSESRVETLQIFHCYYLLHFLWEFYLFILLSLLKKNSRFQWFGVLILEGKHLIETKWQKLKLEITNKLISDNWDSCFLKTYRTWTNVSQLTRIYMKGY